MCLDIKHTIDVVDLEVEGKAIKTGDILYRKVVFSVSQYTAHEMLVTFDDDSSITVQRRHNFNVSRKTL